MADKELELVENTTEETDSELDSEESYSNFELQLSDFEGPIELLAKLIKGKKMDVRRLRLSEITGSYMEYMKQIDSIDVQLAMGFIKVAAELLYLKSEAILPEEYDLYGDDYDGGYDDYDTDYEDNSIDLRTRLRAYFKQVIEDATFDLEQIETSGRLFRDPMYSEKDVRTVLKDFDLSQLVDAFCVVQHRASMHVDEEEAPRIIVREDFTVAQKILRIKVVLAETKAVSFYSLFADSISNSEMINTFLAVLQLLKLQVCRAEQDGNDIMIVAHPDWDCVVDANEEIENEFD